MRCEWVEEDEEGEEEEEANNDGFRNGGKSFCQFVKGKKEGGNDFFCLS